MTVRQFRFDPSQPRDEAGRWTSGGGSASDGTVLDGLDGYDASVAAERAAKMRATAEQLEPEITSRLAEMVGDTSPADYDGPAEDGDLYGYQFRLKSEAKIAEKIGRVMVEKNLTLDEAAADIKDAVRYTVHFPEEQFGQRAQSTIDQLRSENAEVVVKNTWPPEKGVPYKGVNVVVTRSDGVRYEVQFHTPASQAVKDRMHGLYEEQRVLPRSSPRWQQLEDEMLLMGTSQPVPRDADRVFRVARAATFRVSDRGGEA